MTASNTTPKTYPAELRLWSSVGHAPLTNRQGSYCDLLVVETVEVTSPRDAREKLAELAKRTKHSSKGHFYIPGFPNQNVRTHWTCGPNLFNAK